MLWSTASRLADQAWVLAALPVLLVVTAVVICSLLHYGHTRKINRAAQQLSVLRNRRSHH